MYNAERSTEWVCVEEGTILETLDLTGDCRVNMADFALLASEWLECQRIPEDSCNW